MSTLVVSVAAQELLAAVNTSTIHQWLDTLQPHYEELFGTSVSLNPTEITRALAETESDLKQSEPHEAFSAITDLRRALEQFVERIPGAATTERGRLEAAGETLSDLADAYREWLHEHNNGRLLALLVRAGEVRASLAALAGVVATVAAANAPATEVPEGYALLRLKFEGGNAIPLLTQKLVAVDRLYDESCEILGVVTNTRLLIARLEVGSVDADFLGLARAVDFVRDAIFGAARYLHRRFTTEGRIGGLSEQIEVVDQLLSLANRFREAGIPEDELKARVGKSATIIADQLNTLLSDQRKIVVDATEVSVAEHESIRAYVKTAKEQRLIVGGDDDSDKNPSSA